MRPKYFPRQYRFAVPTGFPIPINLSVGMSICEQLHLLGGGCTEENCTFEEDDECILEKER